MTQPALDFSLPSPQEATRRRNAAMSQVLAHAQPSFDAEGAANCILSYLAQHGPTSGEVLTEACKAQGFVPHDDRAFGPVYYGLSKAGKIAKAGTVPRLRGHGTAGGTVWRVV